MDEYLPERDGALLPAREVCALLHVARSTLPDWRARGDLIGYQLRNKHWRYPSNQQTLREARAALAPEGQAAARARALQRKQLTAADLDAAR